ncbi:tight adherence protein B [Microbacteriaceae bacterium SG_E_30_P1]|uniref:Tight adherence protein B n=1 Tax=Antiquaquibacter oligotrophicus TaxID=2880260 RepID=A0ABT6KKF1_9MICO|nr:type II secretion system F family protein [Antiquaquibacter oligotrophicus]MDH6180471.1 tight adherence protein B [Antiquaquibacter oligotrophicus]UDF13791.1 type II secretion system F family protein [Antiquaquibacter oligotrophicus]
MSAWLGLAFGTGLLLCLAPVLWPQTAGAQDRRGLLRVATERVGLGSMHPVVLLGLCLATGVALSAAAFALLGVVPLAVASGLVGFAAPIWAVGRRGRQVADGHRALWPDVIDLLVSAIRSGMTVPDAIAEVAATGPVAARAAFGASERVVRASGDFSASIDAAKREAADPVADRVLETLRLGREVGGTGLPGVLRSLAVDVRQEFAIRSEVAARRSWIVGAARLGVAAPWVVLVLLSMRPEAAAAYNTGEGIVLVLGGLALTAIAYAVMIRIGTPSRERRWFA